MPCYSPLTAYQGSSGEVVFTEHKCRDVIRTLNLPCGQCIGCKLERARQHAVRCQHEATLHEQNSFVTLTYSPECLPADDSLHHEHFQDFMKRLRYHMGPTRFFMGGEYGETNPATREKDGGLYRPHYHACLFGTDWPDKKQIGITNGIPLYESQLLAKIWGMGYVTTGDVTFDSAGYVARYCTKKRTGKEADLYYKLHGKINTFGPNAGNPAPEYGRASNRPGIGHDFAVKYIDDIYNYDHVVVNGKESTPPKYYDLILKRSNANRLADLKEQREYNGYQRRDDNTPERLAAKETVTRAAITHLKRS